MIYNKEYYINKNKLIEILIKAKAIKATNLLTIINKKIDTNNTDNINDDIINDDIINNNDNE
jgi:hypothetical protein